MKEYCNYTLAQVVNSKVTKNNLEWLCDRYYDITGQKSYVIWNSNKEKYVIVNQQQMDCLTLDENNTIAYSKTQGKR